ncbi:MAG: hypothetical protein JZU47_20790 [Prolixibacteraceae bacterium]|nr:hypothetical protein [Prolixibacteraceae bacterium]
MKSKSLTNSMISAKTLLLLLVVIFGLTSCLITDQARTMQVEVMKPAIFTFPDDINKVAIFKRDLYKSDTALFRYMSIYGEKIDSTIKYADLSNKCVDALTNHLKTENYFNQVVNYSDSLKQQDDKSWLMDKDQQISKTNADMFIFLDFFRLQGTLVSSTFDSVNTLAQLSWLIVFKTDTTAYIYNQTDTLTFEGEQANIEVPNVNFLSPIMNNTSEYLGKSFGTKIIPSWITVERMYYKSSNSDMVKAENLAQQNNWLKAAEIWNKKTKNKNAKIVAKACFNMALAAEMEGEHDVAIDWLIKSYTALPKNNEDHKINCQRYIGVLALRKKEIERLDRQVRYVGLN